MKRILIGLIVGMIAGIIDVIPMILIATNTLNIPGIIKGVVIAFMVLTPSAILIGWNEPLSLVPICIMTLVLGSLSGLGIDKFIQRSGGNM